MPALGISGSDLLIDRRRLVGSAAILGSFSLAGCAGAAIRSASPVGPVSRLCLPPVKVSRDRVIRELVGLRPYRDAGFVVRAEALGTKRLVHNYGHGGAGITLSWGTSKLATQLGLPGHRGPVAVLGAGIVGLTTARLVQEAGFPVTIYAEALPPETTSNIAGGQWLPSGHFESEFVTPEWRIQNKAAIDYAYRRFQIMIGEDYGIYWRHHYFESGPPPKDLEAQANANDRPRPELRYLRGNEHPFPFEWLRHYQVMFIEPHRFLRQLTRDIQVAAGQIVVRQFSSPAEVAALPENLIFNCTGLGARDLFGDKDLRPVRGQLVVLLPQPEVEYALAGPRGYMFPRSDGIILGGTNELDQWSTVPDPAITERILSSHQEVFGALRCTRPLSLS